MKISRKISIWTFASLIVVSIVALYTHYRLLVAHQNAEFANLGNAVGQVIEESLRYSMLTRNDQVLNQTLRDLKQAAPIDRIMMLDLDGTVKAGTDPSAMNKPLLRTEKDYWGGQEGQQWEPLRVGGRTYRWVQGIRNKPECRGCHSSSAAYNGSMVIDFSLQNFGKNIRSHMEKEVLISLSAFLVVGAVLFILSNEIIIRRLENVIDGLGKFKDGDNTVRLLPTGNDEITRLSEGFNEMASSIAAYQVELETYARELVALLVSSNVVTAIHPSEDVYEGVCKIAVKEMGVRTAWIGAFGEPGQAIELRACETADGKGNAAIDGDGPLFSETVKMAVRTRSPQVVNEIEMSANDVLWYNAMAKGGCHSSLVLPLLTSDGNVLGVLALLSDEGGYFTRKRIRMFVIFGNQVSAALENRSLIDHLEAKSTELSRQFQEIDNSRKEWSLTFDSITDLISILDHDSRIIRANQAFAGYFHLKPEEAVMKDGRDLFSDAGASPAWYPLTTSTTKGRGFMEDIVDLKTNRVFQVSRYPYHSPEGEQIGMIQIAKDVTDSREKEMRLIMSERLASLGQMASGLAHEINNPLASILGCAEGLLLKVRNDRYDPRLFEEYLNIVEEEIKRCKTITTSMLSFVRKTSYEVRDIDLNRILDKTLEIIGFQGRLQNVEIVRNYGDGLPAVHGSEGELRQVFIALITNALDAMKERGTLTLETGFEGDSVVGTVRDTGCGIAPENLMRIFDPFFTTKFETGGTGLGLSVAHKIITNHNGTILVQSEKGRGTTFVVSLPLRNVAVQESQPENEPIGR